MELLKATYTFGAPTCVAEIPRESTPLERDVTTSMGSRSKVDVVTSVSGVTGRVGISFGVCKWVMGKMNKPFHGTNSAGQVVINHGIRD